MNVNSDVSGVNTGGRISSGLLKKRKKTERQAGRTELSRKESFMEKMLDLILEAGILKKVRRTGWQWRGIRDCESLADHCYRTVLISMLLADQMKKRGVEISVERTLRIATLHELSEVRVGDIPFPAKKYIGNEVKKKAERMALEDMFLFLGDETGNSYINLWNEFEEGTTLEGRLVRAADKIDMIAQALEYERAGFTGLSDYWENDETFSVAGEDKEGLLQECRSILELLVKRHESLTKISERKGEGTFDQES